MRDIKFRGMTLNGDWVYGLLAWEYNNNREKKKTYYISNSYGKPFAFSVRPETIGQFTGLLNWHGEEIYEGDIYYLNGLRDVVFYSGSYYGKKVSKKYVDFVHDQEFKYVSKESPLSTYTMYCVNYKIIGNIHENKKDIENDVQWWLKYEN